MTFKLILLLLTATLFFSGRSIAQDIPVTIKITNTKKEPLAFASVTVINRLDSTRVIREMADSGGVTRFMLFKNNQYTIRVTAVNYQDIEKGFVVTGDNTSFVFVAEPVGKTLEAAVVTAKKPLMRQEDDKLIVDPANLIETSTSGYEVIEKTPGLFVDQDGNVYISSLTPATVQINGRDSKMSPADVATMLKNLPPHSIARIEIVKTPSARYEASGSGGIVNVVLKKGVKIGMTGSVNGGWQQGTYGNQFIGVNINNNTGKKTSTFNINVGKRDNYERIMTDRLYAPDSLLTQDALTRYPANSIYSSYSVTWELGKKWELTYDAEVNYNNFNNNSENKNSKRKVSTAELFSNSLNRVKNKGYSLSMGSGFETKYKIDSLGSEWTNDFFYTRSENRSDQVFTSNYIIPPGLPGAGDGRAKNNRNYFTGRSDLKLKMKYRFTFESGLQSTIHTYHNVTNYFIESSGVRSKDVTRTNTFRQYSNINSLYLQGSKTLGKDFVAKFGTRLENTNMEGQQFIPGDTSFTIQD